MKPSDLVGVEVGGAREGWFSGLVVKQSIQRIVQIVWADWGNTGKTRLQPHAIQGVEAAKS